jgi:hypothetical protein
VIFVKITLFGTERTGIPCAKRAWNGRQKEITWAKEKKSLFFHMAATRLSLPDLR